MNKPPIRTRLRRLYIPNALYFITGVTQDRASILADAADMDLFRFTIRRAKEYHPFEMRAYVIRDKRDLARHFDYIHYNPVKHGYVTRSEAYAHSSFSEYVRRGGMRLGGGIWSRKC